jgi:hypothetical protein
MGKTISLLLGILGLFALMTSTAVCGEMEEDYYTALSKYFEIQHDSVLQLVDLGISSIDIPVTIIVARDNKVTSHRIAEVRRAGNSWMDILTARGVSPEIFYFLLMGEIESKTYTPIFAKFDTTAKSQWESIILSDGEIRDLVNLKFIYSHYDYSVFEVMKLRDSGVGFVEINSLVAQKKQEMIKEEKQKKLDAAKAKDKEPEGD